MVQLLLSKVTRVSTLQGAGAKAERINRKKTCIHVSVYIYLFSSLYHAVLISTFNVFIYSFVLHIYTQYVYVHPVSAVKRRGFSKVEGDLYGIGHRFKRIDFYTNK